MRLLYTGVSALAVGLLPPWARRLYGLPGLPTTDLSASAWARAIRLAIGTLPRRMRESPYRQAAMSRAAALSA